MRQRTYILSSCTADAKVVTVICDYVTTFQDIFVRQSILTYAIFFVRVLYAFYRASTWWAKKRTVFEIR